MLLEKKSLMQVVTPDLKSPGLGEVGELLWVRPVPGHARLGGSALAQVFGQVGRDCPDVEAHHIDAFVAAFNLIQQLLSGQHYLICILHLKMHIISD